MKLLQVTDSYHPATGGMEQAVRALAAGLVGDGVDVGVVTMTNAREPSVEYDGGVRVRRISGWTRHLRRFSSDPDHFFHPTAADPLLVRRLQAIIDSERPNIVHSHGWMLHSCLALDLPAGTALVATLHDYGLVCAKKTLVRFDELDKQCAGPALHRCLPCGRAHYGAVKGIPLVLGLAESRRRWGRIHMFLPISDAVATASVPSVDARRVRVVPSFVPDGIGSEPRGAARPDFLPPAGQFILFVGALGRHKGVDTLIEAHRRMRTPVPLVLLGSLREDSPALRGSGQADVIMHPSVPHDQVMAALRAATAAAVPSRWPEPQGLVAVEAMSAGVPIVASDVGGLADLVSADVGLLVPPGDPDALAAALLRLLDDPALRARMGAAGERRARAYTASVVLPQVHSAYQAALVNART